MRSIEDIIRENQQFFDGKFRWVVRNGMKVPQYHVHGSVWKDVPETDPVEERAVPLARSYSKDAA